MELSDKEYSQLPLRVGQESWPLTLLIGCVLPEEKLAILLSAQISRPHGLLRVWLTVLGESAGTEWLQFPQKCETEHQKGKRNHLLDSKTTEGRPWAGPAVPSEARGKESSQPVSPRKMLLTGRRKEGWQVPKSSSNTYIYKLDHGWRLVKSMRRQSFSAFHKTLLETQTQQGLGQSTLGLESISSEMFTSFLRLISLPRPKTRLSASLSIPAACPAWGWTC